MTNSPVTFARRHILGDLYARCNTLNGEIPVYLGGEKPTLLGHADESLGRFRDAFSFHVADDVCKLLSTGHYTFSVDYRALAAGRVALISITLNSRKTYEKPQPKTPKS